MFDVAVPSPGSDAPDGEGWWKVTTIKDRTGSGTRAVFTGDDLTHQARTTLRNQHDPDYLLLVTPMPSSGLSDQHLDQVITFLTND